MRNEERLKDVDPRLVAVIREADRTCPIDIVVVEGVRSKERQRELYAQGRTKPGPKVTWTMDSNHFKNPRTGFGEAVDLAPYVNGKIDWNDTKKFDLIAQHMFAAAKKIGISIRWGADWDKDGNPRERGESDSPHFELSV